MDDAEYLFVTDCREKKSVGRGYFAKNRTGKGRVKFPSDYLTKKEKNKMNGEVISWDLNKIYGWATFKAMPNDLKLPYLQKLVDTYGVTLLDISKYQFCISHNTIFAYLKKVNLSTKNLHLHGHGYKMSDEDHTRYQQAIDKAFGILEEEPKKKSAKHPVRELIKAYKTEEAKKEEPVNKIDETPTKKPVEPVTPISPTLSHISFEMDGWNYLLLDTVRKLFGNKNVRVSITVEEV